MNRLKVIKKKKSGAQESWSAVRGRERSVYADRWCWGVLAAKSWLGEAFGIWNYLFFLFVSARFGPHDCGPQTNPVGKRLLRLFGLVLRSSGGRGSPWQLTEEPHNFSNEFRYCSFRSKHLQPSSKFATTAGSCYPATVLHMCASCRNAEVIFVAHLQRCPDVEFC